MFLFNSKPFITTNISRFRCCQGVHWKYNTTRAYSSVVLNDSEIVISGIAVRVPESDNMEEFANNLFGGVDMVTEDDRRYTPGLYDLPRRHGKLKSADKFDAAFFRVPDRQARKMDPQLRMLLELSFEAVMDSGCNPSNLRGSNTGVFIGAMNNDAEEYWTSLPSPEEVDGYGLLGSTRSMLANRISFAFDFQGPSFALDTASSSSLVAFTQAVLAIRAGHCDAALVGGVQLTLKAKNSLHYERLGMLSPEGKCKSFDRSADGFVKSEAAVVLYIRTAKEARRVYATIINARTNNDGFKEEGITFPSRTAQRKLLKECYAEASISPAEVMYIEAHGAGTPVGDPEEAAAIYDVFCQDYKIQRTARPLLIGSVKSNMGHAEAAAGLCGLAKIVVALQRGVIPANIHYENPNPNVMALSEEPRLINVVKEHTPFTGGLIGISSIGFGGSNAHVILRPYLNTRCSKPSHRLPLLVPLSGTSKNAVEHALAQVIATNDPDLVSLLQEIATSNINGHRFRGFAILSEDKREEVIGVSPELPYYHEMPSLLFVLPSAVNNSWKEFDDSLLDFTAFKHSIHKSADILAKNYGINLFDQLEESADNERTADMLLAGVVQIAYVDLLASIGIRPDQTVNDGHPAGELLCAYANGNLTVEETLISLHIIWNKTTAEPCLSTFTVGQFKDRKDTVYITLPPFDDNDSSPPPRENNAATKFLTVIGKLFNLGFNPALPNMYPKTNYPISAQASFISPLIQWDHTASYPVPEFNNNETLKNFTVTEELDLSNPSHKFYEGHEVGGRILFPAAGYVYTVWNALAKVRQTSCNQLPVVFENFTFHHPTVFQQANKFSAKFNISVSNLKIGDFQVTSEEEEAEVLASGKYSIMENNSALVTDNFETLLPQNSMSIPMVKKEIYRELRIRGYDYKKPFSLIELLDYEGSYGNLRWAGNWVTFLDNMLQFAVFMEGRSTRALLLPTEVSKITLDPSSFFKFTEHDSFQLSAKDKNESKKSIPLIKYPNVIKCPGIEIRGLRTAQVSETPRNAQSPTLLKYTFVPYLKSNTSDSNSSEHATIKYCMDIVMENTYNTSASIRITEVLRTEDFDDPVIPKVREALKGCQLDIDATVILPSKVDVDENETNAILNKCDLLVLGSEGEFFLPKLTSSLRENTFVFIRSKNSTLVSVLPTGLRLVAQKKIENTYFYLIRKLCLVEPSVHTVIAVKYNDFSWLPDLQQAIQTVGESDCKNKRIILISSDLNSGLIGLVNCLRHEPGGEYIRAYFRHKKVFTEDIFKELDETLRDMLRLDLVMNICYGKDQVWGSYRHLLMDDLTSKYSSPYAYLDPSQKSKPVWISSPVGLTVKANKEAKLCNVHYGAHNKFSSEIQDLKADSFNVTCLQATGYEFSGTGVTTGKKIMGYQPNGGCLMCSTATVDSALTWEVPGGWNMAEAATVPLAYSLAYYSLIVLGDLKPETCVLLYLTSPFGASVSMAAANVVSALGNCKVITNIVSPDNQLMVQCAHASTPSCLSPMAPTEFEQCVQKQLRAGGVDILLSDSGANELLNLTDYVRPYGKILHFGEFHSKSNHSHLETLKRRGISLHDNLFEAFRNEREDMKKFVESLVSSGIASKVVCPLPFKVHHINEAVDASVQNSGWMKALIQIRHDDVSERDTHLQIPCQPRVYFHPNKTYVILGGLGGFGLELSSWLVSRGAKSLALVSRSGIKSGYEDFAVRRLRDQGVTVFVLTAANVLTDEDAEMLLKKTIDSSGAQIGGIFNLAMVLKDALIEDQTIENFEKVSHPKIRITMSLNKVSRTLAPLLDHFVVFSSISSGYGIAGQSNYGFANSIIEHICENRRAEGLPGLAIQWGAIGDVGYLQRSREENEDYDTETEGTTIGGTISQRIQSCLEVLDALMMGQDPIVSSVVFPEKISTNCQRQSSVIGPEGKDGNMFGSLAKKVAHILGVKDINKLDAAATLLQLGVDSIMAFEVRKVLRKEYSLVLPLTKIRQLTLSDLKRIDDSKNNKNESEGSDR